MLSRSMAYRPDNPLIVQADHSVLVEVASPRYEAARDALLRFAELVKAPEHIHTYRITPLSVWNACASGSDADEMVGALEAFTKYPLPENVVHEVRDAAGKYGRLRLENDGDQLLLTADTPAFLAELAAQRFVAPFLRASVSDTAYRVNRAQRGWLKQTLVKLGYPVQDLAGYAPGEHLPVALRETTRDGKPFALRDYQRQAADAFHAGGSDQGGSGVVVLPCGAGKTVVGLACLARLQVSTLVLTTSVTAARQWVAELRDKSHLDAEQIGEYTADRKDVRPVTVTTYQMLTHRPKKDGPFPHLELLDRRNWGLVIYDEVHLLPAPVFRFTAELQTRRRLGLTATLVREDGREGDVFALIGPKKADVPWKELEQQGWIATATCTEVRVPIDESHRMRYVLAPPRRQARVAAENPRKLAVVEQLLERHRGTPTLLIGTYVDQLKAVAGALDIPVLTGTTAQRTRDTLFARFREGDLPVLAVSKVANFAVDLPDAAVAIQISGTFGSRQEEAQRLGRLLRPKADQNQASFYTLVSRDSVEQELALRRQLFLCEQGYSYRILDAESLAGDTAPAP